MNELLKTLKLILFLLTLWVLVSLTIKKKVVLRTSKIKLIT